MPVLTQQRAVEAPHRDDVEAPQVGNALLLPAQRLLVPAVGGEDSISN